MLTDHSPPTTIDGDHAILAMRGIRKSFGGVEALKEVDFDVKPGEVHALVGENGAGKSTLMNILAGVLRPDGGQIDFAGQTYHGFSSAHAAQKLGVAIVFQERSLFGPLTVAENIFAGRQPIRGWGIIDRRRLHSDAAKFLSEVAPEVLPGDIIAELSPAQQQMVEIAKALSVSARIIIFDEPTAALTGAETARLFAVIRQLKARGVAVVYISHRLEEVFALAERVTVLKDGAWQGTLLVPETSTGELIRRMVGRDLEPSRLSTVSENNPVLLDVRGLTDPTDSGGVKPLLHEITFHVRAGEVISLAGLCGAGRTETALALFGVRPRGTGEILIGGRHVQIDSPADAIDAGLGYLSEDRKDSGLFLEMSVSRNIAAAALRQFGSWFYNDRQERAVSDGFRARLRIASTDSNEEVASLSGGNQQKAFLARWLLVKPKVLIVDEPTRGVDVGAKAEVHQLLYDFARSGGAVLMISSELPEVLNVSDRIYVMRAGRITGELKRSEATEEAVLRLATVATESRLKPGLRTTGNKS